MKHFLTAMLLAFSLPVLANAPADAPKEALPNADDPVIEQRLVPLPLASKTAVSRRPAASYV